MWNITHIGVNIAKYLMQIYFINEHISDIL